MKTFSIYLSNQNLSSGIFDKDVHLDTLVIWRIGTWVLYTADSGILKHSTIKHPYQTSRSLLGLFEAVCIIFLTKNFHFIYVSMTFFLGGGGWGWGWGAVPAPKAFQPLLQRHRYHGARPNTPTTSHIHNPFRLRTAALPPEITLD